MKRLAMLLCLLSAPAFAAPTPMVDVIVRLPLKDATTKGALVEAIGKVFGHPAVKRLKLTEAERECATADILGVLLEAMGEAAFSDVGKARVAGWREALKQLQGPRSDWCDGENGKAGHERLFAAMKANGIRIVVPAPDNVASAKEDWASGLLRAFMAAGVLVQGSAQAATAAVPVLVVPPREHRPDEAL